MPLIKIDMWEGHDDRDKETLIANVTKTIMVTLKCPAEAVTIIITDVPKKHWGVAGVPASKAGS